MVESDMRTYYAHRAREFETVYDKPERQADLAALRADLQGLLAGHDVLEIAFEVLKNFPDEAQVRAAVAGVGDAIQVRQFTYFWRLSYRVASG